MTLDLRVLSLLSPLLAGLSLGPHPPSSPSPDAFSLFFDTEQDSRHFHTSGPTFFLYILYTGIAHPMCCDHVENPTARLLRTKLILIELECNEISVVDQITDTGGKNSGTCNKGNLRALAASLLWTCYILADSLCNLVKHYFFSALVLSTMTTHYSLAVGPEPVSSIPCPEHKSRGSAWDWLSSCEGKEIVSTSASAR
ncbi:hypothetical protein DFH09DRAFT_1088829 [Mycena vulgaris]|nr:hypothetical protein DFH09DRAFT_1088829 [Mycena vulgaris]